MNCQCVKYKLTSLAKKFLYLWTQQGEFVYFKARLYILSEKAIYSKHLIGWADFNLHPVLLSSVPFSDWTLMKFLKLYIWSTFNISIRLFRSDAHALFRFFFIYYVKMSIKAILIHFGSLLFLGCFWNYF